MKTLKESLLAGMDDTLSKGDKIVDKILRNKLIDIIHNSRKLYPELDNKIYQDIIDTFTEVPSTDKKGTQWKQVIPDVKAGAKFKPFMINAKKGIYRKATEKELYGTTASAIDKRLKKIVSTYKKYNINNGYCISGSNYKKYFICEYTYVESPSNMNNDWYTFAYVTYNPTGVVTVSFNYDKKEWTFKPNNNIPANILNNYNLATAFISLGNSIFGQIADDGVNRLFDSQYNEIKHLIDIKYLKIGDLFDLKKNPNDWMKINVYHWNKRYEVKSYFYINTKRFEIITKELIEYLDINKTNNITTGIKSEIKTIQGYRYNQASVSKELDSYIKTNYKKVDRDNYDDSKRWFKVHKSGNDAKYGSYMVCFDTEEWRQQSFDDFYAGGIVD